MNLLICITDFYIYERDMITRPNHDERGLLVYADPEYLPPLDK